MPGRLLTTTKLVQRIQKEFEEAPGLAITVDRGVRFWTLDAATCARVLTHLQAKGFLVKSTDGHFRRRPAV
jgi:Fic family protein